MSALPAGIPEADLLETPASVKALINAQQQEIELLRCQLTTLAASPIWWWREIDAPWNSWVACWQNRSSSNFLWALAINPVGYWLLMAIVAQLLATGVRQFRRMEKRFADVI